MSVQEAPICWGCQERIEHSVVYAAPCDHEECPSACFHGLCLMEWREKRQHMDQSIRSFFEALRAEVDRASEQGPSR